MAIDYSALKSKLLDPKLKIFELDIIRKNIDQKLKELQTPPYRQQYQPILNDLTNLRQETLILVTQIDIDELTAEIEKHLQTGERLNDTICTHLQFIVSQLDNLQTNLNDKIALEAHIILVEHQINLIQDTIETIEASRQETPIQTIQGAPITSSETLLVKTNQILIDLQTKLKSYQDGLDTLTETQSSTITTIIEPLDQVFKSEQQIGEVLSSLKISKEKADKIIAEVNGNGDLSGSVHQRGILTSLRGILSWCSPSDRPDPTITQPLGESSPVVIIELDPNLSSSSPRLDVQSQSPRSTQGMPSLMPASDPEDDYNITTKTWPAKRASV